MLRIEQLKEVAGLPAPVLSVYLNMRSENASRHPQADAYEAWLRNEAKSISRALPYHDNEQFLKEVQRIEALLHHRHPEERALAIFAGPATWIVFHLQTPVENEFAWGRPAIGQLFRLFNEHKSSCIVVIDRRGARFFSYAMGELIEIAAKRFEVDPSQWKENTGDSASDRVQKVRAARSYHFKRRVETRYARLCHQVAEQAATLSKQYALTHIYVAGPDRLIEPMHTQFPPAFAGAISYISEDLGKLSREELLWRFEPIITKHEQEHQMEVVTRLLTSEKGAVATLDETLAQLQEGGVRSVVMSRDCDFDIRHCEKCGTASRAADPLCAVCAGERRKVSFREFLPVLLLARDAKVEIVSGEAAKMLEQAGGMGGWLRAMKVAAAR